MSIVLRGLGGRGLVTAGLGDARSYVEVDPPEGILYRSGRLNHVGQPGYVVRSGGHDA